jgi:hypothetical protein
MSRSIEPRYRLEAERLAPMLGAAARYFDAAPAVWRIEGTPVEAYAVRFARTELLDGFFAAAPHAFRRRRAMREYLESLGFAVDAEGLVRTVPTPESLLELLAARGVRGSGFHPRLYASQGWREPPAIGLELYTEGTLGIHLPTQSFLEKNEPLLRLRTPERAWHELFATLGRQMSHQALALHRVPHRTVLELGARVGEAMRALQRAERDDAMAPLAKLYDADLVGHCQEIWTSIAEPDDFAEAFADPTRESRLSELALRRIAEADEISRKPRALLETSAVRARTSLEAAAGAMGGALAGARRLFGTLRGR